MTENELKLSDIQKDALKETANVGAGNAATALSEIVKKKVNLVISDLNFVSLNNLQEVIGGPKKLVVGIYTPVTGDLSGSIVLIFPIEAALSLASAMQKTQVGSSNILSEEDQQVLRNMGNIVCDPYLTSLSQFLEMKMGREDSKVVSTFGESIIDLIMLTIDKDAESGLLIKTGFDIEKSDIKGEFVLLLTMKKVDQVLNKIKEKSG